MGDMLTGPGIFTTFAYYFGLSSFLGCFAAASAMGVPYNHPVAVQAGLLLGLFAGGAGTMLNRSLALELPMPQKAMDRTAFQQRFSQVLMDLSFELVEGKREDAVEIYRRPTGAWLSGRIYVQQDQQQIRVVGRANLIQKLEAKLK
jgi:hypothetical protein